MMGALFSFLSASYYVPKLYFGTPETVFVRPAASTKAIEKVTLRDFVQSRCPSLFQEFRPAWWLNRCVIFVFDPPCRRVPFMPDVQWPFADCVLRSR